MGTENYMPRHSLLGTTRLKKLFLSGLGSNELEAAAIPSFRASHLKLVLLFQCATSAGNKFTQCLTAADLVITYG